FHRADASRHPPPWRPALPPRLRDRAELAAAGGRGQLHLRPSVDVADRHHRRLHRDGAGSDAVAGRMAEAAAKADLRAAAARRLPEGPCRLAPAGDRYTGPVAMSATSRVLTGLASGAVIGLSLAAWHPTAALDVANVAQPIGKLWLNALQMTVVPLVLALVVVGVNTASDAAASGRIARRAIVVFIVLLTVGALFTALAAPFVFTLFPHNPALAAALDHAAVLPAAQSAPVGWIDALVAIVPSNAIAAAAQRTMLVGFFQAIADAMIVIVRWVLWAAPLGVFALILSVCARAGLGMLSALGVYVLVECLLYLSVALMMLPV